MHTSSFPTVFLIVLPYLVFAAAFGPHIDLPKWMGDYSYGIYLWGWPIQQTIQIYTPEMTAQTNYLIAIPLAWVAGAVSWHTVEHRSLGAKRWVAQKLFPKPAAIAANSAEQFQKVES
jgi:peptidoglycan/LPS O-acetylase OafA/YrhL